MFEFDNYVIICLLCAARFVQERDFLDILFYSDKATIDTIMINIDARVNIFAIIYPRWSSRTILSSLSDQRNVPARFCCFFVCDFVPQFILAPIY